MKVRYQMYADDGVRASTAYLDDEPLADGSYAGENKHTGLPVHLRWTGTTWVEVCHREFDMPNPYLGRWVERLPRPECICPDNPPS